jgi:nitrate/nitrite-specific signal transduction histidine kinase
VLTGHLGALRARDLLGQEIVASYAPVPGTTWGLVGEETWDALISGSRGYQRFLLFLLVLGVVAPAVVVALGAKRITRPIADLIGAAQQVASGQFGAGVSEAISAQTGDEIQELAEQFDVMASQLQASYAHLEQRVADRTKELAALNAIAAVVSQSLDLDGILNDALDKTLEVMGLEAGGIYLLDTDLTVLRIAVHRGMDDELVSEIDGLGLGEGFSGRVVQTGHPLVVADVYADPRLSRVRAGDDGAFALVSVPVSSKGGALGALFILASDVRQFTEHDVQFLSSIGHQIGIAVENAQHLMQAERRMQELEALYRADERMYRHLRLDEVLQALVDVAVDILKADKAAVWCWDQEEEMWRVSVARGLHPASMAALTFSREEGIIGTVARTRSPIIVHDSAEELWRVSERVDALHAIDDEGIRSFMHLPIQLEDELFGVFHVAFVEPHAFGEGELRLFSSLGQRAALAIDNAQLYEQTEELAVVEERSRLARELHDAVTQTLFSASLIAEVLPELWDSDPLEGRQLLGELQQLSRGALAEMRTLLLELRPTALVEANLENLLHQLAEAISGREGVPVQVRIEGHCVLSPDVHVALYRIAQEALNNALKHARAETVSVDLEQLTGAVALQIRDDGVGFEVEQARRRGGMGLQSMAERAQRIQGKLTIASAPGQGTIVRVDVQAGKIEGYNL